MDEIRQIAIAVLTESGVRWIMSLAVPAAFFASFYKAKSRPFYEKATFALVMTVATFLLLDKAVDLLDESRGVKPLLRSNLSNG